MKTFLKLSILQVCVCVKNNNLNCIPFYFWKSLTSKWKYDPERRMNRNALNVEPAQPLPHPLQSALCSLVNSSLWCRSCHLPFTVSSPIFRLPLHSLRFSQGPAVKIAISFCCCLRHRWCCFCGCLGILGHIDPYWPLSKQRVLIGPQADVW